MSSNMFIAYALPFISVLGSCIGTRSLSDVTLEILTQGRLYESENFTSKCVVNLDPPCSYTQIDFIVYEKLYGDIWKEACFVFKNESVKTETLPDGYTLGDRAKADYFVGEYTVHFYNVILKDSGEWRCKVNNCPGNPNYSNEIKFDVSTNLDKDDLQITVDPSDYLLLGSPSSFTCVSDRVHPKLDLYWSINGDNIYNTTTTSQPNNDAWTLSNTNSFTFYNQESKVINCILEKTEVPFTWKVENSVSNMNEIAPAVIIDSDVTPQTPTLGDDLTMICTGSGTARQVQWKRRGSSIGDVLFNETIKELTGNYSYGETTATEVTLTWIPPDNDADCGTINTHDGTYYCETTAEQGPDAISKDYVVTVHYIPFLENSADQTFNKTVGDEVTMSCDVVCASPGDVYYLWTSENGREELDQNKPMISFDVEAGDFNDTFFCRVNNSVGSISRKFNIAEIVLPTLPPSTSASTVTEPSEGNVTTETPNEPHNRQALIIANAVIWSLCGVVAVVLVCLALYHYRQIQNGKKYHGDYSEDIVLTDDEEKPGTSHGFGSDKYHDISHSDVGKGAVGGAVGGNDNEGLYAEVKTPSQNQMPVAPKRASKVQTPQPQPSTPKAKRTHPINAPKSPMDAQHQPSSRSDDRRPEPKADYSPVSHDKEMLQKHSNESNHGMVSKVEQQQKRQDTSNKLAAVKQKTNGAKPSVPNKPNITSYRSSRSSGLNLVGAPYDNAEVNLYANCDQGPVQKHDDDKITYADLALQQEDPYDEGAPPVPTKNMNDQDPVQYASIKHIK